MDRKKVLVVGASGFVGGAAIERFAQLPDWEVVAVSRRAPLNKVAGVTYVSADLLDVRQCAEVFGKMTDITHVIYAAVSESPDNLVAGWSDTAQIRRNGAMLENLFEPLSAAARGLEHVLIMQGTKAYAVHLGLSRPHVPLSDKKPRIAHENFYFEHEDYIIRKQSGQKWHWTVLRPPMVVGGTGESNLNTLLGIGVYGAIRKEMGLPFSYPARVSVVADMVDVDLMARCMEWAATAPGARNQIFNITNGDVFTWPDIWPIMAEALGTEVGPNEPLSVVQEMARCGDVWAAMVRKYRLRAPADLHAFMAGSFALADLCFSMTEPILMSTIKLREAGFHDCTDSEETVRKWFRRWQELGFLPPTQ